MKTKNLLSVLFTSFFLITTLCAQNPNLAWVKQIGGTDGDYGQSITTDANGNVYTTGNFWTTADFDPGVGVTTLTSVGFRDIFVQKLDINGNLLWVKQMGGTKEDFSVSIATDANGNVYTTGFFEGTADFDPGVGTANLTSLGEFDIFIQKLDGNGNLLWVKQLGGTGLNNGNSITIDASGNVYTTGYFRATVDFDPGAGTTNLTSSGGDDIYIEKLDANGNFLWVVQMGGGDDDSGNSITIDASGNVYSTGYFVGTADFDPGTGTTNLMSAGERDIFIQKLNANGNFIWAKQMGGIKYDEGQSITIDDFGNICTTGNFEDTADFDPGAGTTNLTSLGDRDIFTQKLDTDGNFLWAKQMGGIYTDRGQSITSDANGNVFTIGYFSDLVDFDPGVGTYNLTSKGWADIFIQKLDANGNFQWTIQMGGTGYDFGQSITTDGNGNIYSTGFFSDTVDFDPGAGTANLTSVHGYDVFIQKLNTATVGMIEKTFSEKIVVYPNPTNGKCSIEFDNHQELLTVSLRSLTGQEIMTRQFRNTNRIQLEINQPSGIYILEIVDGQGKMTALKIIKE